MRGTRPVVACVIAIGATLASPSSAQDAAAEWAAAEQRLADACTRQDRSWLDVPAPDDAETLTAFTDALAAAIKAALDPVEDAEQIAEDLLAAWTTAATGDAKALFEHRAANGLSFNRAMAIARLGPRPDRTADDLDRLSDEDLWLALWDNHAHHNMQIAAVDVADVAILSGAIVTTSQDWPPNGMASSRSLWRPTLDAGDKEFEMIQADPEQPLTARFFVRYADGEHGFIAWTYINGGRGWLPNDVLTGPCDPRGKARWPHMF